LSERFTPDSFKVVSAALPLNSGFESTTASHSGFDRRYIKSSWP
jgi:hypothetical protein